MPPAGGGMEIKMEKIESMNQLDDMYQYGKKLLDVIKEEVRELLQQQMEEEEQRNILINEMEQILNLVKKEEK